MGVDAAILLREHGGDAQHDLIRRALEVIAAMLPEQYRGVYTHGAPTDTPPSQPTLTEETTA